MNSDPAVKSVTTIPGVICRAIEAPTLEACFAIAEFYAIMDKIHPSYPYEWNLTKE